MAWKLTIDLNDGFGARDWTQYVALDPAPQIDLTMNERTTAEFTLLPAVPSIPPRYAQVVIYDTDGTTPIFGGLLNNRNLEAYEDQADDVYVACQCSDFGLYSDWCLASLSYPTDTTPEDVINDLVTNYLSAYGITYTKQATGLTLDGVTSFSRVQASQVLKSIFDRCGLCYYFTPTKALVPFVPGGSSTPFNITDAAPHYRKLTWTDSDKTAANKITVVMNTAVPLTEVINCPGTVVGNYTYFTTQYPCSQNSNDPWPLAVVVDGVPVHGVLFGFPTGVAYPWGWDYVNHRLVADNRYVTPPGAGHTITISYAAAGVVVTGGGSPVIEVAVSADVSTIAQAQQVGEQQLAQSALARAVTIESFDPGWRPGQSGSITATKRKLVGISWLLNAVKIELAEGIWKYTVTGLESTLYQGSYLDQWRALAQSGGSSNVAIVTASGVANTLMVPLAIDPDRAVNGTANTWQVPTGLLIRIDSSRLAGVAFQVRAHVRAADSGVGVTARLWNVTTGAAAGTGVKKTATTMTEDVFGITVAQGINYYRLELSPDTTGKDVFGIAILETL